MASNMFLRLYHHAKQVVRRQSKRGQNVKNQHQTKSQTETALLESCLKNAPRALLKLEPESAFIEDADGNNILDLLFLRQKLVKSPVDAQVIRYLLSTNPNLASKYNPNALSKLHPTVLSSDGVLAFLESYTPEMMLESLLKSLPESLPESLKSNDNTDFISTTVLHLACRYNATTSPDLIEKMLKCLPPFVIFLGDSKMHRTPLHWACCAWDKASSTSSMSSQIHIKNNTKVVQMLLKRDPCTAMLKDNQGFTPIHLAVHHAAPLSTIEALLSRQLASEYGKAAVITRNVYGDTPLHTIMELDSSPPSSYMLALLSMLVRANPRAVHDTYKEGLSLYQIAATRPAQLIMDYCRHFLYDVRLVYGDDVVKDMFKENNIRWTGYHGEYLYSGKLKNYECLNASKSQKYLDYFSIFITEANGINDDSNANHCDDFDVGPPHIEECRKRNIVSVVKMWDIVKGVLAKLAVQIEHDESINAGIDIGALPLSSTTSSFPTDDAPLKMSFQSILCTCLNMEAILAAEDFEFPIDFILFLLKIMPKRRKAIVGCGGDGTKFKVDRNHGLSLPLHIALDKKKKNKKSKYFAQLIHELVRADPSATGIRNFNGELPLASILKMGARWDDGAKDIFLANPIALFDEEVEHTAGARLSNGEEEKSLSPLIPYVLERISREGAFDAMYELIREKPEFAFCF